VRQLRTLLVAASLGACGASEEAEPGEERSGGDTTVFDRSSMAFSFSARNLVGDRKDAFFTGNSFFDRGWVIAPASTIGVDGLGPTFNATGCNACHLRDGRGRQPEPGRPFLSILFRISVPGDDGHAVDDPIYGGQINDAAIPGVAREAVPRVSWEELPGTYGDGTPFSLRKPTYRFEEPGYGAFPADLMVSPRVAPANFGLGLLEAIPETDLVALADPDDADGDGISGRPNQVYDLRKQTTVMGRFGWKAGQPTIEQQTAAAFLGDIGITSSLFPVENCPPAQTDCLAQQSGGTPEIDDEKLHDVVYYGKTLAVPGRRDVDDPTVLAGKRRFREAGCASCHVARHVTGVDPAFPELSNQIIFPYTDLLLHDMGDALADGRPEAAADGREWRTPPLWGIGLIHQVNGHTELLHDARARDLAEAILWHGGEAEASREKFRLMDAADRAALLRFLESL
jgi:CxxC motif-containing protein (DUF1111 family)